MADESAKTGDAQNAASGADGGTTGAGASAGGARNDSSAEKGAAKTSILGASDESSDTEKGAGEKDSGSETEGASDETEGAGEQKPTPVDISKIKAPEGTVIDEKWMGRLAELPGISKLSQEDVQGQIDLLGEFVQDLRQEVQDAAILNQVKRVDGWNKALQEHPAVAEFEGFENLVGYAKAARDAIFSPSAPETGELMKLLTETGLGSHPAMVVGLAKIAKAFDLKPSEMPGGGSPPQEGGKKTAAEKLFPDYAPGGKYATR